jgi:hypothetical protein
LNIFIISEIKKSNKHFKNIYAFYKKEGGISHCIRNFCH